MIVLYGQCLGTGDGKWRVRLGEGFVPGAVYDDEALAKRHAEIVSGGSRRVLRTTFTLDVRTVKVAPGVAAGADEAPPPESNAQAFLNGLTVRDLTTALGTGDFDKRLMALLAAETTGAGRKGALAAIEARMDEVSLQESEREPMSDLESEVREHFKGELAE